MPTEPSPEEPENRRADEDRLSAPARLCLRAAAAAVVIGGLSLHAAHRVDAPAQVYALAPVDAPAQAPEAAARAPRITTGPARPEPDPATAEAVRAVPGRNDPAAGWREERLARGAFAAIEAPVLRLTFTRGAGAGRAPGLRALLARRAAEAPAPSLAVVRTGAYGRVETRFGAVETLEIALRGPLTRTCTGLVTREAVALRVDGWLCAPLGRAPEPAAVARALDALARDGRADGAAPAPMSDPAARTGSIGRRDRERGRR